MYHCPPDVLERQDAGRVLLDVWIASIEAKIKNSKTE